MQQDRMHTGGTCSCCLSSPSQCTSDKGPTFNDLAPADCRLRPPEESRAFCFSRAVLSVSVAAALSDFVNTTTTMSWAFLLDGSSKCCS